MVSIDSCLNNVTQNDAWCFSNRLAGYNRRIAGRYYVAHNNNRKHSIQFTLRRNHTPFIHRVSFNETLSYNIQTIVHCKYFAYVTKNNRRDCSVRSDNTHDSMHDKWRTFSVLCEQSPILCHTNHRICFKFNKLLKLFSKNFDKIIKN